MSHVLRVGLFAGLCLISLGCSHGPVKPKLYSVSGKVTVAGKPLTDCGIQFVSTKDSTVGYGGTLDASGNYTLTDRQDGRAGAQPGKYKVVLEPSLEAAKKAMSGGGQAGPMQGSPGGEFPPEYSSAATSPKEVEVQTSSTVINIEIP